MPRYKSELLKAWQHATRAPEPPVDSHISRILTPPAVPVEPQHEAPEAIAEIDILPSENDEPEAPIAAPQMNVHPMQTRGKAGL